MADGSPHTVLDLLQISARYLESRGVPTSRLDTELLLGDVLGLDRLQLYVNFDRPVSSAERDALREHVRRRAAREPVALILGRKEFRSRDFVVPAGVLVPRPDTELLADLVIDSIGSRADAEPPLALDLGTGSGILAVSVAAETAAQVLAVDAADVAIAATRENARLHGVADRIGTVRGSWYDAIPDRFSGKIDVLMSNPPYVSVEEYGTLAPEIVRFEPRAALVPGDDPLAAYLEIAAGFERWLAPGARVFVEIGAGRAAGVEALFREAGLRDLSRHEDLAGIERVVTGVWETRGG